MTKHTANTTEAIPLFKSSLIHPCGRRLGADVEALPQPLHAEKHRSPYLVGTKDVSEVDEGERALPGLPQRLKKPCLEAVTSFGYFHRIRHSPHLDIISFQLRLVLVQGAGFFMMRL